MKRFAITGSMYKLFRMKLACMIILIAGSCFAQSYEARTINLVDGSAPDLEAYQANLRGYEWTVKNGSAAVNLTGNAPFMYWYQEPLSASIITARITIVSATAGTFRAVFLPSDLNPSFMSNLTSGATNLRYGVGVDYSDGPQSVKHGRFRLLSDPFSAGSVGITFYSTNVNWALINWSGLPSYLTDAPTDGGIYARKSAAWYSISGYATGGQWAADIAAALVGVATGTPLYSVSGIGTDTTARAWAQSGSNLAATAFGWGNHASAGYATGAPVYSLTGYATGTPVYAESDPIWSAASNSYLTTAAAESRYATGTPVYAVSGLGTDATARAWALGASNRADAAYAIAAAAATGTPLYAESFTGSVGSVVGLATGTPLYAESDPVFVASSNALLTKAQAALLYATGTPLYVESNPSLAALSNGVANAITTGSLALAVAEVASNLAAGASGWGNHATNGYAVQGGNITGRWYAVGNTNVGLYSIIGGGIWNGITGQTAVVGGGFFNIANGISASILGGRNNFILGGTSTIGGGGYNTSYGLTSVICGGGSNTNMDGFGQSILGGNYNYTVGDFATILGGYNNKATTNALAAGIGARATNSGSFVLSAPGTTNVTFGSIGDNSFAGRFVGGVYFLSPTFHIQDTNGNTIARFSATNTTISGSLNLTGYATTSDVLTVGIRATNAQITASNAATTASAATNLAIALSASATNGLLAIGQVATNGQQVASNALSVALGIGVTVTNGAGLWNHTATGTVAMATNRITQLAALSFANNANVGDIDYGVVFTNGFPVYAQGTGRYSIYGTWNFSPSSYQTAAAQASYATNALKLFAGAVTQNQVTARNQVYFDSTNLWIGLGGTNSIRFGGVLNAY